MKKILLSMFWVLVVPHFASAGNEKGFEHPTKKVFTETIQTQPRTLVQPLLPFASQETLIPPLRVTDASHKNVFIPPLLLETDPPVKQVDLSAPVLLLGQPVQSPGFGWSIPPLLLKESVVPSRDLSSICLASTTNAQQDPEAMLKTEPEQGSGNETLQLIEIPHELAEIPPGGEEWIIPAPRWIGEVLFRRAQKENLRLKERANQVPRTEAPISQEVCPEGFQIIPLSLKKVEDILRIALHNPPGSLGYLCPFPECLENQRDVGKLKGESRFQGIYKNPRYLREHVLNYHCEASYFCPVCEDPLPSVSKRTIHMTERHPDRKFVFCSVCPEGFELKPGEQDEGILSLKEHVVATHAENGEKWFPCSRPDCPIICTKISSIKRHERTMHQDNAPSASPDGQ